MRSRPDTLAAGMRELLGHPGGPIPLHAPVFWGHEREYVMDCIESTFVSSVGEYVNRFESMLTECTGAKYAVACVNGTAGLQIALTVAGVPQGSLVLTQGLSFAATANAIVHAGAEPVFLDIDPVTLGLSPVALTFFLEKNCRKTSGGVVHGQSGRFVSACVPMHTFGFPVAIQEIVDICSEWGIPVVEDAAEALGSSAGDKACGTFGLLSVLSFNGNKICTTGGGGAIVTNDSQLARMAKHLTTTAKKAHPWAFEHDAIAWNFRLPNLNAALGCAQLENLPFFVARKRIRAEGYAALFADSGWTFLREPAETQSNYWLCSVLTNSREERDAFLEASNAAGVMTRPAWTPLGDLPVYAHCIRDAQCATRDVFSRLVNLPSGMLEKDKAFFHA